MSADEWTRQVESGAGALRLRNEDRQHRSHVLGASVSAAHGPMKRRQPDGMWCGRGLVYCLRSGTTPAGVTPEVGGCL
jgi:hypothetical protein